MDFLRRKRVYLITLIILIILIPLFYVIFTMLAPGLNIDANLDLKSNPKLKILIENTSSHTINNLIVYLNGVDVKVYPSFLPNSKEVFEFPVVTEKTLLEIVADNHLPFEREFSLNQNNLNENILNFKPSYLFNESGQLSDVNMKICSTQDVEVNVEVLTDGDLKSNALQNINLKKDECKILDYHILYLTKGEKKVTFKIYNDVYSKELLISGSVN